MNAKIGLGLKDSIKIEIRLRASIRIDWDRIDWEFLLLLTLYNGSDFRILLFWSVKIENWTDITLNWGSLERFLDWILRISAYLER